MIARKNYAPKIAVALAWFIIAVIQPMRAEDAPRPGSGAEVQNPVPPPNFADSRESVPSSPIPENSLASPTSRRDINLVTPGEEVSAIPNRLQYGLRLNIRAVYDDNIYLNKGGTTGDRVDDLYFAIEPGITFGFGDVVGHSPNFIRFDYAPSAFLYLDHSNADALQHIMKLEGQYRFGHLSLGLSQDVQLLEGANPGAIGTGINPTPAINLDAGGNADVNIYTTNATASYDLTGKTFLSGGARYSVYDYPSLISSQTIDGNLFINYNYSPKLVIGLGGTAGYNWVDAPNPNQSYQQLNARLSYQLSGKVSLNASGGVEYRQFENDARDGNYASPVYELDASYQPFDGTNVTLTGSRRTENSAVFAGQDYVSTTITLGVRQRFLRRIYFGATIGYENSTYFNTIAGVDASRDDNYFFVQPAIDVTLMRFWTVGAYYLHRQDNSSADDFTFYDNQVGLRTSFTF